MERVGYSRGIRDLPVGILANLFELGSFQALLLASNLHVNHHVQFPTCGVCI